MYWTYIIASQTSGKLYIGQTNNLADRLRRHNENRNKWTRGKGPWELVYTKGHPTRSEAVALERRLKSYKNKAYLMEWIRNQGA